MNLNIGGLFGLATKLLGAISSLFSQLYVVYLNYKSEKQVRELDRVKDNEERRKLAEKEYIDELKRKYDIRKKQDSVKQAKPLDYKNRTDLEDL